MAQLIVRNVEDSVKVRLQRRARKNGRSTEEEIRDILRDAVKDDSPRRGLGTSISRLFSKDGIEEDIREFRGQTLEP